MWRRPTLYLLHYKCSVHYTTIQNITFPCGGALPCIYFITSARSITLPSKILPSHVAAPYLVSTSLQVLGPLHYHPKYYLPMWRRPTLYLLHYKCSVHYTTI